MESMLKLIFRALRRLIIFYVKIFLQSLAYIRLWQNGVDFDKTLVCNGLPIVDIGRNAKCKIGRDCSINSNIRFNPIGRYSPTFLIVKDAGRLIIGNNTGISSSAIVCHNQITIGNYVKLGGNVVIYDTDFHSLQCGTRRESKLDLVNIVSKPVIIEDDVFIGAHSTILKGVCIGKGAIVGAGSVVTKNIPAQEIWGGNPARYIKKVGC